MVLAILGILATVAWSAYGDHMATARSAEAVINVGRLFNTFVARAQTSPRWCPGTVLGPTPAFSVRCAAGPGGKCNPSLQPAGAGQYSLEEWDAWRGFGLEQPHHYHYTFVSEPVTGGCKFTAAAHGDLDDDGVFSTFERSGASSLDGVAASPGIYIDQRTE